MPENTNVKIKEIAQSVDSCETLPVPLRDDMGICHPELVSGSPLSLRNKGNHRGWFRSNGPADVCDPVSRACEGERGRGEGAALKNSEADAFPKNETNLFTCLEFAPRSQRFAYGARVPAGSLCSLSGFAHFVRAIRPQIRYSLITLFTSTKAAFTLAEVLITLAIIGVVAALTIPSLIENHNEKAWSTAKDLWQKKLVETTRQMNIDGVMTGVASTTEDYMDYFKKYVKVIKTCDNNKLKNCYAPKIVQTAGDEVEVSGLKTSNSLGQKWNTNTVSFVIADGTTVIMAYNPNCDSVDPFSKEGQNGQVGCMSMMIDVNGKKGPNKVGKDILLSNASISTCDMQFGDLCLGGSDIYPITPINTCSSGTEEDQAYDDRGDHHYCSTNYWAGAKKACDALDMRLPTMQELADIATYIYKQDDNPIGAKENRDNISPDSDRASELSWSTSSSYYWSSESGGDNGAYLRSFYSSVSHSNWNGVYYSYYRARCVSN